MSFLKLQELFYGSFQKVISGAGCKINSILQAYGDLKSGKLSLLGRDDKKKGGYGQQLFRILLKVMFVNIVTISRLKLILPLQNRHQQHLRPAWIPLPDRRLQDLRQAAGQSDPLWPGHT